MYNIRSTLLHCIAVAFAPPDVRGMAGMTYAPLDVVSAHGTSYSSAAMDLDGRASGTGSTIPQTADGHSGGGNASEISKATLHQAENATTGPGYPETPNYRNERVAGVQASAMAATFQFEGNIPASPVT